MRPRSVKENGHRFDEVCSDANVRSPFLRRLILLLNEWRRRVRDRNALAAMSDPSLRDIGLTRYDIELEVRKPFWRA